VIFKIKGMSDLDYAKDAKTRRSAKEFLGFQNKAVIATKNKM
jgi:hypothetical protein